MKYIIKEDLEKNVISIKIHDKGKKKDGERLKDFLNMWNKKYNEKKHFSFLLDGTSVLSPSAKDCYKVIKFIREMKKRNFQYLNYTIIIINNYSTRNFLFYMFKMQSPVAPVFLVKDENLAIELNTNIKLSNMNSELVKLYCELNDIYFITNKTSNKEVENTVEAIHIIDDSVNSLNNLLTNE